MVSGKKKKKKKESKSSKSDSVYIGFHPGLLCLISICLIKDELLQLTLLLEEQTLQVMGSFHLALEASGSFWKNPRKSWYGEFSLVFWL